MLLFKMTEIDIFKNLDLCALVPLGKPWLIELCGLKNFSLLLLSFWTFSKLGFQHLERPLRFKNYLEKTRLTLKVYGLFVSYIRRLKVFTKFTEVTNRLREIVRPYAAIKIKQTKPKICGSTSFSI